jgi:trimeric autotransporter adhesin
MGAQAAARRVPRDKENRMPTTIFDPAALADGTSTLTVRADALATSTDLVQAGALFNDATRLLDGGLWSTPHDAHNQENYLSLFEADLNAALSDVNAMLANPASTTIGGATYALSQQDVQVLSTVQGQLQSLLAEAPHSVGHSTHAAATQNQMHDLQASIVSEIQGDAALSTALDAVAYQTKTGATNTAFQALPTGADTAADLAQAQAPGDTLAHVGGVFNAAANIAEGGLNHTNMPAFQADIQAVATGVQNILNNPAQLAQIEAGESGAGAQLTTIHLQTIENELQLQLKAVDHAYQNDPSKAARETNDNLLDIIDIVQGDANLNHAAGGNGSPGTDGGFAEEPSYLSGTITHYQDNQAETNFWANFITQANVLGSAAITAATAVHDGTLAVNSAQVQNIIADIHNYDQQAANFDQRDGGIFGARFDNELLGGTLQADASAAIHSISTGNVDQARAAAVGFIADAADVSGNNIPVGGGAFVSQTLANGTDDGAPNPHATVAAATTVAGAATESHATAKAVADAGALTGGGTDVATGGATAPGGALGHHGESHHHDFAEAGHHHFGHMWG